jgi:hypothetical protein
MKDKETRMTTFQKAVQGNKLLRIVVGGETDAGKSFTSLLFAAELAKLTGKRTAAVDTENGRLSHRYASKFDFDVVNAQPPFEPARLTKLIHEAEGAGYGQFIIDSGSDYYEGMLAQVKTQAGEMRSARSQSPNPQAAWGKVTPTQNELYDAILRSSMHILFTVRERSGQLLQRKDFAFKFDLVLVMDKAHAAIVSKSFNDDFPVGRTFQKPNGNLIRLMTGNVAKPEGQGTGISGTARQEWVKLTQRADALCVSYTEIDLNTISDAELRLSYAHLHAYVAAEEKKVSKVDPVDVEFPSKKTVDG